MSGWREWYPREILAPWLVSRLALMLVAWMAMFLLHHNPPEGAWEIGACGNKETINRPVSLRNLAVNMWSRWDASWYHDVAAHGYRFSANEPSNTAFFPVYPMAMRAAHAVVSSHKDIWWFVCGIVVSNVALLGCLTYLFLLVRMEFDTTTARRAVLYLLIFPTTLFLSAVYSESAFLLTIVGSFYHARKREWWWAGLLGAVATLSRPPGIMIIVGLLVEYLLQCEFQWRKLRWNALALSLPLLALGSFLTYLHFSAG
ncbi:MAG: mannosyltransferase family protein, partial [Chthoniobacterales bacterium]